MRRVAAGSPIGDAIYPNGVNTAYQYDNLNRLANLAATHTASGTPITNFGYQLRRRGEPDAEVKAGGGYSGAIATEQRFPVRCCFRGRWSLWVSIMWQLGKAAAVAALMAEGSSCRSGTGGIASNRHRSARGRCSSRPACRWLRRPPSSVSGGRYSGRVSLGRGRALFRDWAGQTGLHKEAEASRGSWSVVSAGAVVLRAPAWPGCALALRTSAPCSRPRGAWLASAFLS